MLRPRVELLQHGQRELVQGIAFRMRWLILCGVLVWLPASTWASPSSESVPAADAPIAGPTPQSHPLYTYTLTQDGTPYSYDEAMAVASLQGIINRESATLYVLSRSNMGANEHNHGRWIGRNLFARLRKHRRANDGIFHRQNGGNLCMSSRKNTRPQYWLDIFSRAGGWLEGRELKPVPDLGALVKLAGQRLKGAVIWDPAVPATFNVATTIAGVRDGVVLSPAFGNRYLPTWRLPVLADLRGRFTGAETGSKKNDAYRWAIREYLAKGRCSSHLLCLYEDSFTTRARGEIGYVVTRDWAVKNRSFVFDLSPWGDERPADDLHQRLGLDLETYKLVLAETLRQTAGRDLTEMTGFFVFSKYANIRRHKSVHEPVPTEWETVRLISPYNVYQNTSSSDCYNQSLHSHAIRRPLRQDRVAQHRTIKNKTYICILMADYDSAYVLYDFLPKHWDDPSRGKIPLAWGINPNLLETYPDVIAHIYLTMTPADTITADAGAAGYINPSRIRAEYLPLFVRHNRAFFREADLTIAPMVLDWVTPSAAVKDAYQQFAPDGFGSLVWDMHTNTGPPPMPHVWKGMPVVELINDANEFPGPRKTATLVANAIKARGSQQPGFYFFRIVWASPTQVIEMLAEVRRQQPTLDFEVLDVHTFFALFKEHQEKKTKSL